jgi:multidrug resistance efflux pump
LQVNKDKKVEMERLQAELAAAKRTLGNAEGRAEQMKIELEGVKSKKNDLLKDLQVAKADAVLVVDIQKRISKVPAGLADGSTLLAQVLYMASCKHSVWSYR